MKFRKLILSLLIVTAVGATGFAATRALLTDQAVLGTSTFSTGTVDLKIASDINQPYTDGPVTGFTSTLKPGTSKDFSVWLQNATTDTAMSLAGKAVNVSGTLSGNDINITFTKVADNGDAIVGAPTITKTLTEWSSGAAFQSPDFDLASNTGQRYKMTVTLANTVTNSGTFQFDFQFTGTQIVTP
jgi:hypothetical protein